MGTSTRRSLSLRGKVHEDIAKACRNSRSLSRKRRKPCSKTTKLPKRQHNKETNRGTTNQQTSITILLYDKQRLQSPLRKKTYIISRNPSTEFTPSTPHPSQDPPCASAHEMRAWIYLTHTPKAAIKRQQASKQASQKSLQHSKNNSTCAPENAPRIPLPFLGPLPSNPMRFVLLDSLTGTGMHTCIRRDMILFLVNDAMESVHGTMSRRETSP